MMLLLAAIDVGGSLPALPALYHVEKQNGTILPYFPAILPKIEESIRRPLYLGCQQIPDALRASHGAFRIWAVMPGEKTAEAQNRQTWEECFLRFNSL